MSSLAPLSPTSSQQAPTHAEQFSESWPVNSFVSRREGEILSRNLSMFPAHCNAFLIGTVL